jgi:hypothetical protein
MLVNTKPPVTEIGSLSGFGYDAVGITPFNIEAIVNNDCQDKPIIKSVKMTFDNSSTCENYAPFTAFSSGRNIALGNHTITATSFSNNGCAGTMINALSRNFIVLGCSLTFRVYDANTNAEVTTFANGDTVLSPPCNVNVKVDVSCGSAVKKVGMILYRGTRKMVRRTELFAPFFLFGNSGTDVKSGTIASGTYTLQTVVDGIVHAGVTFTFNGTCIR